MRSILVLLSLIAASVALYFGVVGYGMLGAYGQRGLGLIGVGAICGLLSCTLAVLASFSSPDRPPKELQDLDS